MTIHFEGASERRKELVQALVEATGNKSEYMGAPSFDYKVGEYAIHRDGRVEVDDLTDTKALGVVLQALRGHGFLPMGDEWNQPEEAPDEQEVNAFLTLREPGCISLVFPKDDLSQQNIANLRKLVDAKAPLIQLSLEVTELPIEEDEDQLTFPWLPGTACAEMIDATAHLLTALIKLSKKLKRVTVTQRDTDNPRYTFRCLLLRLGFIGDEYKQVRKHLMQGIPGNASQRHMAVEDAESVQDESVETEPIEKLKTQTDVVTEEELAALPSDEAERSDMSFDNRSDC